MRKLTALAILSIFLTACNGNHPVPSEFNTLHSEVEYADSLNTLLDSNSIWTTFNKVKPYYLYLSSTDFDSSLADVYIHDLTWLDRYQRALGKWRGKYRMHTVQLDEALSRLDNLKHDIQYDLLEAEQVSTYIEQERSVIQGMLDEINARGGEILYYSNDVDSMQTRLDSIFPNL